MKSTAVIGVGNILFTDDGIGVYAAEYLKKNYSFEPEIEILDGGTLGFNLMHYLLEYDQVFILDTVSIDDTPGTIYHLDSEALLGLGDCRKTVHEVEVTQMIELGSMMEMRSEVTVIGIIPDDIQSVAIDVSPHLKQAFEGLIQTCLDAVQRGEICVRRNETSVTLDGIIQSYRHPTIRAEVSV